MPMGANLKAPLSCLVEISGNLRFSLSILFLLSLSLFVPIAQAQPRIIQKIKPDGKVNIIQVPPAYPHTSLTVTFPSKGNETLLADFILRGPNGAVVEASARVSAGGRRASKSYPLSFQKSGRELRSIRLTGVETTPSPLRSALEAAPSDETASDPCKALTQQDFDQARAIFFQTLRRNLTDAEICQLYRDATTNNPNPVSFTETYGEDFPIPPSINYISNPVKPNYFEGFIPRLNGISDISRLRIRKDSCSHSPRVEYQVELEIALGKVSAATRAQGFSIEVGINAPRYRGDRASSIKPVSEGKFAPQPLFLMTAIGGLQHRIDVVRWTRNRPTLVGSRDTADFVFWRRHFLTRTPAGALLRGGRATVELSNGSQAYSVCFELRARRQNVAGYGR